MKKGGGYRIKERLEKNNLPGLKADRISIKHSFSYNFVLLKLSEKDNMDSS